MTKIFYFSGTGNSLWSAKKIAQAIGENCEIFNIGKEAEKTENIIEADSVVFVFPSYAYGLPLVVRRFAEKSVFNTSYIAAFVTYGSNPGGSLASLCRILKKKEIKNLYFGNIPAAENYTALFGAPKAETLTRRLSMQKKATEEAALCVTERKTNRINTFCPFSFFVSFLFSFGIKIFYKFYRISDDCDGCGICVKVCSVSAVILKDRRPVFSGKCEHCQGCVNICPLRAIHFGRVNSKTPVFCHPEAGLI